MTADYYRRSYDTKVTNFINALSVKGTLWKNSIQILKTTDLVLLSLFMRVTGRCNIPNST